jgi:hypothetical protein
MAPIFPLDTSSNVKMLLLLHCYLFCKVVVYLSCTNLSAKSQTGRPTIPQLRRDFFPFTKSPLFNLSIQDCPKSYSLPYYCLTTIWNAKRWQEITITLSSWPQHSMMQPSCLINQIQSLKMIE